MRLARALSPALEAALMREVARLDLRPAPTPDAPASLGEFAVTRASLYIAPTARDRAILWAETWGQVAALARSGSFPEDQRTWVARAAGVAR
jgi:hypothetical protein